MRRMIPLLGQSFFHLPTPNFQLPTSILQLLIGGMAILAALAYLRRDFVPFYRANRERVIFTAVLFALFYLLF
ncbi:MAG TPA: hypothetical protein EYP17_01380, partial [Candidatus Latescibacteria bacterium]|nr:hypothetical protein [Candidatus Latescibacterota bacterium]